MGWPKGKPKGNGSATLTPDGPQSLPPPMEVIEEEKMEIGMDSAVESISPTDAPEAGIPVYDGPYPVLLYKVERGRLEYKVAGALDFVTVLIEEGYCLRAEDAVASGS